MAMYRMQILLRPEQRRQLERIARREGRSLSDVTRRAIDEGLRRMESDPDEILRGQLEALEALTHLRKQIQESRGIYQGDPVTEARAERAAQVESVWQDE